MILKTKKAPKHAALITVIMKNKVIAPIISLLKYLYEASSDNARAHINTT